MVVWKDAWEREQFKNGREMSTRIMCSEALRGRNENDPKGQENNSAEIVESRAGLDSVCYEPQAKRRKFS